MKRPTRSSYGSPMTRSSNARTSSWKTLVLLTSAPRKPRRLREYLLKGGFVFSSDYWGDWAREQFDEQIGLALPPGQYPIVDLPLNHSIWNTLFDVKTIPQMPSIQSWRRGGGNTDRGVVDSSVSARHRRRARPAHGRHAAQHRYSRRLGTGRRGSRVPLSLLTRCVRGRHQYRVVHDDALRSELSSVVENIARPPPCHRRQRPEAPVPQTREVGAAKHVVSIRCSVPWRSDQVWSSRRWLAPCFAHCRHRAAFIVCFTGTPGRCSLDRPASAGRYVLCQGHS